jgi:hypothetical protein
MHWKRAGGRQYLFRSLDRQGNGKSLGPRSPETEQVLADFQRRKTSITDRLTGLRQRIAEHARFCRALRIGRVPRTAAAILRLLDQQDLLGNNVQVVGTHCLYAYEAKAGLFLDRPLMATADLDLMWDPRPRLKLMGDDTLRRAGLMGILKKADRSFAPLHQRGFRAVNRDGFMVDLIKAAPRSIQTTEPVRWGEDQDLHAAEIRNLQWLISAPKFTQVVIGEDGFPAPMVVPDPRAFALHKSWIAEQVDREPVKKTRDRQQALTVARLTVQYLPDHPFSREDLRMFPQEVVRNAAKGLASAELPPGFE